jgi:hypothetical protein
MGDFTLLIDQLPKIFAVTDRCMRPVGRLQSALKIEKGGYIQ